LQSAAMFHATAQSERESVRNVFSHGLTRIDADSFSGGDPAGKSGSSETAKEFPIVVAPNGVELPDLGRRPGREILEIKFPELKDRSWVVFMSRLHPKKGVDVLLRAWSRQKEVTGNEWRVKSSQTETPPCRNTETPHRGAVLVLAGSNLIGYRKEIEGMIKELSLEDSVVITGEVLGQNKDCLLANSDVFVLPSHSENFGIVVAEAMAWGRPVIASTGAPWKEVAEVGAGWWVKPEEESLAQVLHEALAKRPDELDAMGAKGRALVAERYTWAAPAAKLVRAYEEILATAEQSEPKAKPKMGCKRNQLIPKA